MEKQSKGARPHWAWDKLSCLSRVTSPPSWQPPLSQDSLAQSKKFCLGWMVLCRLMNGEWVLQGTQYSGPGPVLLRVRGRGRGGGEEDGTGFSVLDGGRCSQHLSLRAGDQRGNQPPRWPHESCLPVFMSLWSPFHTEKDRPV